MASSPITSWQRDGQAGGGDSGNNDRLGFKITVDGDSSQEIKRHLLLGRKAVTNLDIIL